ncbi:MAG: CPBP family intramembrane metalloprotease [Campylobacteraceae bacterium]|nr:CPBP family intramembrane metalloprotease [Campylobacteraceae bacterium]
MKNLTQKQKIALISAVIYTVLIGIGMYTSLHVNGISYDSPRMPETLIWFEIIMSIFALFMAKKYFTWEELGFKKTNMKNILWFVPMAIMGVIVVWNLAYFTISNASSFSSQQWQLFTIVAMTTFLVGFSEELMYRGIIFSAFLQDSKVKALLVSAVTFSLLHSVNVFAGVSFGGMGLQLFMTFIAGLFFAFVRLKIENIIPLMIYHWFWDFTLIGGQVLKDGDINGNFTTAMILFQLVFAIIVIPYFIYKEKKIHNK